MEEKKSQQLVLNFSLITTLLSLAPTIYVTVISNSLTLVADLLRSLVEFLAIAIAWIITKRANPENLRYYNYGFGKLEQTSSICAALAMFLAFIIAVSSSVVRFLDPKPVQNTELGFALAILSVIGNSFVWYQNVKLYKASPSPITESQAQLFRSKTFACSIVVVSLLVSSISSLGTIALYADPVGSLLIGIFLLYSGYTLIFKSLGEILDQSLEEGAQLIILRTLVKYDSNYRGLYKIRTRRSGGKNYIELWLIFDGNLTLNSVQKSIEQIKSELEKEVQGAEVLIVSVADEKL